MAKLIKFREVCESTNDSTTVVLTSLIMKDEDIEPMNAWFHEIGFIPEGKNLVDWKKIDGNVRGDEGRSDILLIFDRPDLQFSPIVRLQLGYELKWTSDFVTNFARDYIY